MIEKSIALEIGEKTIDYITASTDENDPVLKELREEVAKTGLSLRIHHAGEFNTAAHQFGRLNVYIEKGDDGKYRIGNTFKMG